MIIGILSGKGGTGKTTVAVNLSDICEGVYVDCDVEEPNGFIFNQPEKLISEKVYTGYPEIDSELCDGCGECAKACMFNALMSFGKNISVFPKLCHDCGACAIVCKKNAITFKQRDIGITQKGIIQKEIIQKETDKKEIYRGVLNIGEPMAVPVIKNLMKRIDSISEKQSSIIVDCAPGTSCNIVTTIEYLDKAVIVAEPSLFSLSDMKRTVEVLRKTNIPFGVVINKAEKEIRIIHDFCEKENIRILGSIDFSRKIAERYSRGEKIIDIEEYRNQVSQIWENVKEI